MGGPPSSFGGELGNGTPKLAQEKQVDVLFTPLRHSLALGMETSYLHSRRSKFMEMRRIS